MPKGEWINSLRGLYVNRHPATQSSTHSGLVPNERITIEEAIKVYTYGTVYLSFEELQDSL